MTGHGEAALNARRLKLRATFYEAPPARAVEPPQGGFVNVGAVSTAVGI